MCQLTSGVLSSELVDSGVIPDPIHLRYPATGRAFFEPKIGMENHEKLRILMRRQIDRRRLQVLVIACHYLIFQPYHSAPGSADLQLTPPSGA